MAKELDQKARDNWICGGAMHSREIPENRERKINKIHPFIFVDENDKLLGRVPLQELIMRRRARMCMILWKMCSPWKPIGKIPRWSTWKKYDLRISSRCKCSGNVGWPHHHRWRVEMWWPSKGRSRQPVVRKMLKMTPFGTRARSSGWWLALWAVSSAHVLWFFEGELAKVTAISFFVPLIQATGGNVGIQSSSLVVQSLAHDHDEDGLMKRLAKVLV